MDNLLNALVDGSGQAELREFQRTGGLVEQAQDDTLPELRGQGGNA